MAGNMLIAFLLLHTGQVFILGDNGGWRLELQGLLFFGALSLVFLGGGSMAVRPD